ncbi:MAG: hypothetical protein RBS80_05070 [Thermoguttaceae bacterium]|jgi:DNA transposition AAA+ family ATPase|nr:hypothetical protein [Thermoguttaceae bacterium]
MLTPEMVEQIRKLLATGRMSRRGVARRLRVSRGTVDAIARGRRPDYAANRRQLPAGVDSPAGPLERCPGCGGMVRMPCLACRVRALRKHRVQAA